jgi:hypothetical protein
MQAQQQATEAWSLTRKAQRARQGGEISMVLAQSVVLSESVPGSRRGSRGWGLGGSEVAGFGGFASATSRCVSPQPHSETDGIGLKDL